MQWQKEDEDEDEKIPMLPAALLGVSSPEPGSWRRAQAQLPTHQTEEQLGWAKRGLPVEPQWLSLVFVTSGETLQAGQWK